MEMFSDACHITRRYGPYIDDVRRLFVFHGLSCGTAENFAALASTLAQNRAFRTDISALARSICDLEDGRILADEMLTVIALASGGAGLVADRTIHIETSKTAGMILMLLAEACAWRTATQAEAADSRPSQHPVDSSAPERKEHFDAIDQTGLPSPGLNDVGRLEHAPIRSDQDPSIVAAQPAPNLIYQHADAAVSRPRSRGEGVIARGMDTAAAERSDAQSSDIEHEQVALTPSWAGVENTPPMPLQQSSIVEKDLAPTQERFSEERRTLERGVSEPPPGAPASVTFPRKNVPVTKEPGGFIIGSRSMQTESLAPAAASDHGRTVEEQITEVATHSHSHTSTRKVLGKLFAGITVILVMAGIYGLAVSLRHSAGKRASAENSSQAKVIAPADPVGGKVVAGSVPLRTTQGSGAVGTPQAGSAVPAPQVAAVAASAPAGNPNASSRAQPPSGSGEMSARVHAAVTPAETVKADTHEKVARSAKEKTPPIVEHGRDRIAVSKSSSAKETPLIVSSSAIGGNLISAREPAYPPEAIQQHLEGTVVLNAFIAKDGTVRRMDVVEGSSVFIKSAVAATSWRRYKPYLVNGQPVEVQTLITIKYPRR